MPPYPRKLINEGENVVLDLKPHWFFFWKHILVGIAFLVVFIVYLGPADGSSILGWPLGIGLLVFAGFVVEKYLVWTYTHFVLTDRRVISRSGIVSKRGTEIPLERINNIDFHQNIFLRMIGAGDLDIESAGKDGQSHFDNVRHPDMVQQEVYRQMEANARRQASWSGEAAASAGLHAPTAIPVQDAPDIAEQITKLAALRDQGHITDAEYEAKKAELLERM
ncbi:MAG: PH domain-containing protein [Acidimicrobiia bacterium]